MNRIVVEKKPGFDLEGKSILKNINSFLGLNISYLKVYKIYDVLDATDQEVEYLKYNVFGELNIDNIFTEIDLSTPFFAKELLPAQFDLRAESAKQCLKIQFPKSEAQIFCADLFVFEESLSEKDLAKIKSFLINPIEAKEKYLNEFGKFVDNPEKERDSLKGFNNFTPEGLLEIKLNWGLAMTIHDLEFIQSHFKLQEFRDPTRTEILVLDIYWSDHCRHTTFETTLESISVEKGLLSNQIEESLVSFNKLNHEISPHKPLSLMNLATINARNLIKNDRLPEVEISDEINACSIFRDIIINGQPQKYLFQFKNETHNHPTEIEPFGGAATCLGGAIRDPLSGRSYVYQAMRISGSGNPFEKYEETLDGKLPQRLISKESAHGFASYGNQIGLATTYIQEIVHPGFKAKHLELGVVVGTSPASIVKRLNPKKDDLIVLIGGRTGRDGIGGATGSSKNHNLDSINISSSEVQKGNALEERKLQRLFSLSDFANVVKKSNDFGAGGAAVAICELTDSLEINLNEIPLKYLGLGGTDILISESQERMAIVIDPKDLNLVHNVCKKENLESSVVAKVTDTGRVIIKWNNNEIFNLSREFLNTNGVSQFADAVIQEQSLFHREICGDNLLDKLCNNLTDSNVASQKGLQQIFDSTIGNTTVQVPYGGKTQLTKSCASVQKVHLKGEGQTEEVTLLGHGYNPYISSESPYLGSAYAIVESISRVVAAGGSFGDIKFSFQEYFEKLTTPQKWGKPLASLLGAYETLTQFDFAAIGGKDSMSGSFENLDVPPSLISFAFTFGLASRSLSPEFKSTKERIYILKHIPLDNHFPNTKLLKDNFIKLEELIRSGVVTAAQPVLEGGIAGAIFNMSIGNLIGGKIETHYDLFELDYGTIIFTSPEEIIFGEIIGETIDSPMIIINGESADLNILESAWSKPYEEIYPSFDLDISHDIFDNRSEKKGTLLPLNYRTPTVLLPIFPGTNCEYDLKWKFKKEGAEVKEYIFKNYSPDLIPESLISFASEIDKTDILVFAGGFSAGDEPDGSGKYIANVLKNQEVKSAIQRLIIRKGLILGICNGFQALIKSGLLSFGEIQNMTSKSPTLVRNSCDNHISTYVVTEVSSNWSPWLSSFNVGERHTIPISHGEGRFCLSEDNYQLLKENGQIAFSYVENPNGSDYHIEGVVSPNGLILGKMGHSERHEKNIAKNISGNKDQNIFKNAVNYFKGLQNE